MRGKCLLEPPSRASERAGFFLRDLVGEGVDPSIGHRLYLRGARERSSTCQSTRVSSRRCACARSEEHTSELQSRENLVCRLLLEKKKCHQQTKSWRNNMM